MKTIEVPFLIGDEVYGIVKDTANTFKIRKGTVIFYQYSRYGSSSLNELIFIRDSEESFVDRFGTKRFEEYKCEWTFNTQEEAEAFAKEKKLIIR